MIDDGYSLIEITNGVTPQELFKLALKQRVTLPDGRGCSFDKVGLTTDSAAPRIFKIVVRKIDGQAPSNMYALDQSSVAYDSENDWVVETRTFALRSNAELGALAKAKARELVSDKLVDLNDVDGWNTYRLAVKARFDAMKSAFLAGTSVDIETGAIDGVGAWPS